MFPIEILPKPDEMVRAGLVFDTLEGQQERIGWLPALPATLRKVGQNLASPEFSVRTKSRNAFLAIADLGLGILAELAKSKNPEIGVIAEDLTGVIRSGEDLGPNALHPSNENSEGLIELLYPAKKPKKSPEQWGWPLHRWLVSCWFNINSSTLASCFKLGEGECRNDRL